MIDSLIGKKISMTQVFTEEGKLVPVTVVQTGPCSVIQVKTVQSDKYRAVQLGFEEKGKNVSKPLKGHFEKHGVKPCRVLREVRLRGESDLKPGDVVGVDIFEDTKLVHVTGITKGKGFQGTIKRHGFTRGPAGHGSKNVRAPGSIGQSAWPSRVFKGMRMAGHMGHARRTVRNIEIVKVDKESNLLLLKGSVPGPDGGHLIIRKAATRKKAEAK
ncbi:MAG: 50S ribosomal protein L3 [Planctomycetota bacterium]|nr:MAG: 50S ribosomal protein L3 [Planctomycetota bacterium]